MVTSPGPRNGRHSKKPKLRLSELRCFLLAATVLLAGLSLLYTLSSTQLKLTSETDYRRLSFIATVRRQQEIVSPTRLACELSSQYPALLPMCHILLSAALQ